MKNYRKTRLNARPINPFNQSNHIYLRIQFFFQSVFDGVCRDEAIVDIQSMQSLLHTKVDERQNC